MYGGGAFLLHCKTHTLYIENIIFNPPHMFSLPASHTQLMHKEIGLILLLCLLYGIKPDFNKSNPAEYIYIFKSKSNLFRIHFSLFRIISGDIRFLHEMESVSFYFHVPCSTIQS